jgi:hypothetical protein
VPLPVCLIGAGGDEVLVDFRVCHCESCVFLHVQPPVYLPVYLPVHPPVHPPVKGYLPFLSCEKACHLETDGGDAPIEVAVHLLQTAAACLVLMNLSVRYGP